MGDDDWIEYRRLIVSTLEELRRDLDAIRDSQQKSRVELELVKFKVMLTGVTAGFIASALVTVLKAVFFGG